MMAVWCTAGALLLVLLTGLSYSYPMQQAQSSFQNAPPGYAQGSSAGPASKQGISWAVAPPSPFSAGASTGPSTQQFAASGPAPQPLGLSFVIRPDYFLPQYQAGELFQELKRFEQGHSESENEAQGSMPPPRFFYAAQPSQGFNGGLVPSSLVPSSLVPYPYPSYDYMFLSGPYPPGTYTYTSNSFEQGRDSWEDAHYTKDSYPSTQQAKNIPRPRTVRQASIGSASHGLSGAATGQQQPYSGDGVQGSYSQLGRHRRGAPRAFMQKVD